MAFYLFIIFYFLFIDVFNLRILIKIDKHMLINLIGERLCV